MTVRFAQWTLDVHDIERMLAFWSAALGYDIDGDHLRPPGDAEPGSPTVWLQRTDAVKRDNEAGAQGDTAVLVMIERQHGEVGGLPDQDWSLRVTHVYRREGSDWMLVHRHADPLVHKIDMQQISVLTHGELQVPDAQ
jgi:hypothetical protein